MKTWDIFYDNKWMKAIGDPSMFEFLQHLASTPLKNIPKRFQRIEEKLLKKFVLPNRPADRYNFLVQYEYMLSKYMEDSIFRSISFDNLHGEDITKAAENNDFIALKTFQYTGNILGKALANFVSFSQPEAIILTGGLVHSGKWILEPTIKSFEKNLLPFYKKKVKILTSGLEDKDSAILGSAALVWKNI